ncbi:hypothetical protein BDN67DRAFT_966604 [Paxillus ammoniavirescens]|nr:hypothetical protein BDN67DRAFT_966604 [Paxillus ammoniavirescens]
MPASFVTTPPELLEEILLSTVRDAPRGPPAVLRSLLLTCRMSHDALSSETNPHLFLTLFFNKFDIASPRRHLAQERLTLRNMGQEVRRRYAALQIIKKRDVRHPDLVEAFATIYVMLLEDDGLNWEQMLWADLPTFLQMFLRECLLEDAAGNHGWPLENELNTLAIALFWLMLSSDRLNQETEEFRRANMDLLLPFVFAGFRYPCFTSPEHLFLPSENAPKATVLRHGIYPPDRPSKVVLQYFGEPTTLHLPPIALFAILSYFSRLEKNTLKIPPELPANRQDAIAMGILWGPTKADIEHFNTHCTTRLASATYGDRLGALLKSRRHDPDWHRSLFGSHCGSQPSPPGYYIPGTISGHWQGSFIAPCPEVYRSMLFSQESPSPFPTFSRFPLYVKFRELYCYSPSLPLPDNEEENSFLNGFLPIGCHWHESESGVEFIGKNASFKAYYTPPRSSHHFRDFGNTNNASSIGAFDVIVTGVTEEPYATAWIGYKYIGRIRPSDGLVVLLREPLDSQRVELGRALFRGYIVSSRNFVGRWRHVSSGEQPAEWESVFTLCKEVTSS